VNQILKTAAWKLIRSSQVDKDQKKSLKKVIRYFNAVDTINPSDIKWAGIKYHRNNSTYKMLINICYMVFQSLLPTTQEGSTRLSQFKDDQMHRLFEKFVFEYYRKHCPICKVSAAYIDWNVDDGVSDLLPDMKSDIMLEHNGKTLIIDTKYYGRAMQTNALFNSHTIHSGNLYQIFAYVKNKDIHRSGNVSGILLYAKTDEEITPDNTYFMNGNKIGVKTLDLDKNFADIRSQLDKIVAEWLS
jgi:5-methylcytosine-specific restriction enzyme subunit McrC